MHPFHQHRESKVSHDRAKSHLKGYAMGGDIMQDAKMVASGIGQHERNMHPGKPPTKLKMPTVAEGMQARQRLDRAPRARGGRAGKKATTVNVMVNPPPAAPAGGVAGPMLADAPVPMPPSAPPAGPPMMPPKPPMAGPGGPGPMMRARGGRTYDAGAGSGEGREAKVKAYGANAKIKDTTKAVKGVKGEGK